MYNSTTQVRSQTINDQTSSQSSPTTPPRERVQAMQTQGSHPTLELQLPLVMQASDDIGTNAMNVMDETAASIQENLERRE